MKRCQKCIRIANSRRKTPNGAWLKVEGYAVGHYFPRRPWDKRHTRRAICGLAYYATGWKADYMPFFVTP